MSDRTTKIRYIIELRRLEADSHNNCSKCGISFEEGKQVFSGYGPSREPLVVCSDCKAYMRKLVKIRRWQPLPFTIPDPDTRIWRYMDISKFIALLHDRTLYFTRADQFPDKWEAALGSFEHIDFWKNWYLDFFRKHPVAPVGRTVASLTTDEIEEQARQRLMTHQKATRKIKRQNFVSCWHENAGESEAFWRLYCPPDTVGIAIYTTYQRLRDSLGNDPDIRIGRVLYLNYRKVYVSGRDAIFRKRSSLEHEHEIRAVIQKKSSREGLQRPVDIDLLIEGLVLSPFGPQWLNGVLTDLLAKYGVARTFESSDILLKPF